MFVIANGEASTRRRALCITNANFFFFFFLVVDGGGLALQQRRASESGRHIQARSCEPIDHRTCRVAPLHEEPRHLHCLQEEPSPSRGGGFSSVPCPSCAAVFRLYEGVVLKARQGSCVYQLWSLWNSVVLRFKQKLGPLEVTS